MSRPSGATTTTASNTNPLPHVKLAIPRRRITSVSTVILLVVVSTIIVIVISIPPTVSTWIVGRRRRQGRWWRRVVSRSAAEVRQRLHQSSAVNVENDFDDSPSSFPVEFPLPFKTAV